LSAGGGYVPVDPQEPGRRLQQMLADSAPAVVVTTADLQTQQPGLGAGPAAVVAVAAAAPPADGRGAVLDRAGTGVTPAHLAYVLYTSGSTGTPKGVMVGHQGVVNWLQWMQRACALGPQDVVLQKTPATFDVSVWEYFATLASGARLVLAQPGGHKDPAYLQATIAREGVTTVHFVPSMLTAFLDAGGAPAASLRQVVCSGE